MDGGQRRQEADRLDEGKRYRPRVQPPAAESNRCAAVISFPVMMAANPFLYVLHRLVLAVVEILVGSDFSRSFGTSHESCLHSCGKERSETARFLAFARAHSRSLTVQ